MSGYLPRSEARAWFLLYSGSINFNIWLPKPAKKSERELARCSWEDFMSQAWSSVHYFLLTLLGLERSYLASKGRLGNVFELYVQEEDKVSL